MKKRKKAALPLLRAIIVFSSIGIILTGITFATLQSSGASLTGNTITSATADLRISTTQTANFTTTTATGYTFSGVVPGGAAAPASGNPVYLRSYSDATTTAANLQIKVAVSTTPTTTTSNPSGATVDLTKVYLDITRTDTNATQAFSIKSLIDANTTGGLALTDVLAGGTVGQYLLRISMDSSAFTAQSATISGITFVFYGVGV